MSICLCYHDEPNFLHERGVCYGTKEKEPCSCGGNPVMCDFYEEVKEKYIHRTHGDSIRAMTDEELAEFIAYSTSCETCVVRKGGSDECHNTNCSTAWLGWMKQEATNA